MTTANDLANFVNPANARVKGSVQPSGSIIQVVQVVKTDTYTQNSNSFTTVPGLSATITPVSTSSRILVAVTVNSAVASNYNIISRISRNGTPVFIGDASGSRPRALNQGFKTSVEYTDTISATFVDSPASTSALTYAYQVKSGVTLYVNRTEADRDTADYDARMASSIILMEIAG